jgi:hypothetical protein
MKNRLVVAGKAVFYFGILAVALPILLDRRITAAWILGSAGISLVITVLPAYIIARLSGKRAENGATAVTGRWARIIVSVLERKWIRVVVIAIWVFALMAFIVPAVEGRPVDTAWLIISAIGAIIGAVVGDYLNEKQRARKARKRQRHE